MKLKRFYSGKKKKKPKKINQLGEEEAYRTRENLSQLYTWQEIIIQDIQRTQITESKK